MYRVVVLLLLFLPPAVAVAGGEPLKYYSDRHGFIVYQDDDIVAQAARFPIGSPVELSGLSIRLLGGIGSSARVHIYGDEGGASFPLLERDLISPITITKKSPGNELLTITFPRAITISGSQFYIVVDQLAGGARLLSDQKAKRPTCTDDASPYTYQALKKSTGEWTWGKFSYVIDAMVEYHQPRQPFLLADVTENAGLKNVTAANPGIAWADYDGNGSLDLLVGGKLYRNQGNGTFIDATTSAGITGAPKGSIFIDINNDMAWDILFAGDDSSKSRGSMFINNNDGTFTKHPLDLPAISALSTLSIADANDDGYPDLFVGQHAVAGDTSARNFLLLNDLHGVLREDTVSLPTDLRTRPVYGSEWIDADHDGTLDLYVTDQEGNGSIWRGGKGAVMTTLYDDRVPHATGATAIGCSWRDYDNNGTLDMILPQGIISREGIGTTAGSAVLSTTERDPAKLVRNPASDGIAMMVNHAGGTWGDVDNDGLADLILTSSCSCTPVDLYLQTPTHAFERKTFEAGLFRQPGGEDATWVDVNNDGKLDLAFLSEGRLYLYQNQNTSAAHFVEIDLLSPDGGSVITGADVVVAAGGKHYRQIIASGRGLMMQDPTRLHFGLGEDSRIDSITVTMPNGHAATTFRDIPVDRIARLNLDGKGAGADALAPINVSATPNPFSTRLAVQYTLAGKQHVRVEIYSPSGALAQILVDEEEPAGEHVHYWNTIESDRATLSQGAYLYRITADGHEATGKVILQR